MNHLIEAALRYREWGLSVVPVSKDKYPFFEWRSYQKTIMGNQEIIAHFSKSWVHGIAIICGQVSGNFEGIDIDSKYDLSHSLIRRFNAAVREKNLDLFNRLTAGSTRNVGYHFYYRCSHDIGQDIVLASRESTREELLEHPNHKVKVLIETRSNGGLIVVPPTPGYRFIQHDLSGLPVIEPRERDRLFSIARSFNLYVKPPSDYPIDTSITDSDNESPFHCYDQSDDIVALLQQHGWIKVRRVGPRTFFKRPGITDKDTSGNYHHGLKLFKTFSTSTELIARKAYLPHTIFAILECHNDFKLAAKRLLAEGYGVPYINRH